MLCVCMQAVSGENWGFDGCEVTVVIELCTFNSDFKRAYRSLVVGATFRMVNGHSLQSDFRQCQLIVSMDEYFNAFWTFVQRGRVRQWNERITSALQGRMKVRLFYNIRLWNYTVCCEILFFSMKKVRKYYFFEILW